MPPPRDRVLLAIAVAALVLWLGFVGPLRTWASGAGLRSLWLFGVAPSFFAGSALACWQAYGTRTGPPASAAYAFGLIALAEALQLALPRATPDAWDLVAGAAGSGLGALAVWVRQRRTAAPG